MSALAQDVRYTLRTLRRSPGFTLVAILTLALGIGGTTAIFSVVDGVVLRALPYPTPDRLVSIVRVSKTVERASFSPADFLDLKRDARQLAAIAGYREDIVDLTGTGDPERLRAMQSTAGFFDVFGAGALRGRTFSEATDRPEGPRVAVISEGLWQRRFGGREGLVGSTVRLNGQPTIILGVMPAWFRHPQPVDAWLLSPLPVPEPPVTDDEGNVLESREIQYFSTIARVRSDVSLAQAEQEVRSIAERIAKEFPETNVDESMRPMPLADELVGETRGPMMVLLAAVAVVLLIACANVASLLLARGAGRRRELAVRTALGAGRWRLVRQLLTESVVLAVVGGVFGVLLAFWLVDVLVTLAPRTTPRLGDVQFDWRVALFATACSTAVGVIFGLAPAITGSSPAIGADLKDGGRSSTTARTRLRNGLVIAEVGMAMILLIAAGLLLTSFMRLRAVDPGFRTTRLFSILLPLPLTRYDEARQRNLYQSVLERLRVQPETAQSAAVFPLPLTNSAAQTGYRVVGRDAQGAEPSAEFGTASPSYFETMGIPLLRGREFTDADTHDSQPVVIVNQALAEREWPGRDPIGETLAFGGSLEDKSSWVRVVGVVGDSKRRNLQTAPVASLFLPYQQLSLPYMAVVVRSDMGLGAVATAVRQTVQSIDRDLPIGDAYTVEQMIERSTGDSRFRAFLIAAFAAVALTLAVIGIYGLISYTVAQRVPEIGVRLALGATPVEVRRLVLGDGLKLAGSGIVVGLVGAVLSVQAMQGLLFAVSATSPLVYGGVSLLLFAVAGLACLIPARRAMRIDPVMALRSE